MAREERDYSHRSLIDKLGVKREHRICLRGALSRTFVDALSAEVEHRPATNARGRYDLIFLQVDAPEDLRTIATLAAHLEPAGALWIVHPKGKGASPSDGEVRAAGLNAGLVDNKISAYTDTHTVTRYVIPKARR
ncbi:MAG: hypothetical protein JO322_07835 [Candidatus Eremiobacteraeota bacterium]|nr:hypothetical protein [Candidatus Eremiobacteraeota bacterium]